MTELPGTDTPTKPPPKETKTRELMAIPEEDVAGLVDRIVKAIYGQKLAVAKLWNPDPGICKVDLGPITGTITSNTPPEPIREKETTYGDLDLVRKRMLKDLVGTTKDLTDEEFSAARIALKQKFITWGLDNYTDFTAGNCTCFTGAILGLLVGKKLVPAGIDAEYGRAVYKKYSHAFVIIGRTGPVAKISSWGKTCLVIDHWYARQQNTTLGMSPVKNVTDPESPFYDPTFLAYLSTAQDLQSEAYFPSPMLRK